MIETLDRLRDSLIRATAPSRLCRQIGPFYAMLSPNDEMYWLNYAVPTSSEDPEPHLDELEAFFRENHRLPRFEFFHAHSPVLRTALEKRGYELQGEMPLMVCDKQSFIPRTRDEVVAKVLGPNDELELAAQVSWTSFDNEGSPPPDQVANLRSGIEAGRTRVAIAYLSEDAAGAAYTVGDEEVCELAGVGTLPKFRRKRIASVASSALMAEHFKREDGLVWLSAGDEIAKLVYEKLGFQQIGVQLNYILQKV